MREIARETAVTLRQTAFGVAYRMLGNPAEAEDVAQQSIERLLRQAGVIERRQAFIATIATRQSLNVLRNAGTRQRLLGTFGLPIPAIAHEGDVDVRLDLPYGLMVLTFALPPLARAVFILREAFDLDFDDIAHALGSNAPACRKALSRARRSLAEHSEECGKPASSKQLQALMQAITTGDIDRVRSMLSEDIILHSDGGGRAPAFGRPVHGQKRIARFLAASPVLLPQSTRGRVVDTPSGAILLLHADEKTVLFIAADALVDRLTMIYALSDPIKLELYRNSSSGSGRGARAAH